MKKKVVIRISKEQKNILFHLAKLNNMSLSQFIKLNLKEIL